MSGSHEPEPATELLGCGRLTPLADALAALAPYCVEVAPDSIRIEDARDCVAAAPIYAPAALPSRPIALCDGWAVEALDTLGASPYAPCFARAPPARVGFGDPTPDFANAVLPLSGVAAKENPAQILSPAAPGEGLRARGGDFAAGERVIAVGKRLRPVDLALLRLAGIAQVPVRVPKLRILAPPGEGEWLAALARREGAGCAIEALSLEPAEALAEALARPNADLVIAIGAGGGLAVAHALATTGKLLVRGVAVRPGEMMGCGVLDQSARPDRAAPVIFAPERIECVLAAWLLLARPCLRRLAGMIEADKGETLPLARKLVSSPGLTDLVLLRRAAANGFAQWEPVATGDIPFSAIANAEAWLAVAPESEGCAAGRGIFAEFL